MRNKYLILLQLNFIYEKIQIFIKPRLDKSSLVLKHLKIIQILVVKRLV